MDQDEKQTSRRRLHRLRVPVFPEEKDAIERQAKQAGLSVARYLRDVGQGYQIKSIVDYEQVCILVRINSDLGRLGGLLKLWLTDDVRTAHFSKPTLRALLRRIETTQDQMSRVMKSIIQPRVKQ
ncbi:MAG: conjugal transfer protein TraJ [Alphaproteobacteria bacterium 41-28]|nr:MAG: conjugal transfer protein TraJ [Alphaproteobacteria bacterium 41-28]